MEQDTYRTALAAVQKICAEKGEADAADIAKAVGLSSAAAEAFVRQIDEDMPIALRTLLKSTFAAGKNIL